MSGVCASKLSGDERIAEIVSLLAIGLARLKGRQSSSLLPPPGDSYLDLSPHQSGGAEPKCTGEAKR